MTDKQAIDLIRAIREHSDLELAAIRDAGTGGADMGFGGFTYTSEAAEFTEANSNLIDELLQYDAEEFGYEDVASFVGTFNRSDMTDTLEGYKCLLAWYALETAGHWLNDRRESRSYA
jgi:hypothetical protein